MPIMPCILEISLGDNRKTRKRTHTISMGHKSENNISNNKEKCVYCWEFEQFYDTVDYFKISICSREMNGILHRISTIYQHFQAHFHPPRHCEQQSIWRVYSYGNEMSLSHFLLSIYMKFINMKASSKHSSSHRFWIVKLRIWSKNWK